MATISNNNNGQKGFASLNSLASDVTKDITDASRCPKCGHVDESDGQECGKCGIIYSKYNGPAWKPGTTLTTPTPKATPSTPTKSGTAKKTTPKSNTRKPQSSGGVVLCDDTNCFGVVGSNGICKKCGNKSATNPPQKKTTSNKQSETSSQKSAGRKLCSDGRCIGIVNNDGRCSECGKSADEISDSTKVGSNTTSTISSSNNEGGGWGKTLGGGCLGIAVPFIVLVLLFSFIIDSSEEDKTSSSQNKPPVYAPSPSEPSQSKPRVTANPTPTSSSKSTKTNLESKPPVGKNNVLNRAQMRYCLSEKIRLDSMENFLDNYSDQEVDWFNRDIGDYNSRCSEFRYKQGSLQSVRKKVEVNRWSLEQEGKQRVQSWRTASSQSKVKKSSTPKRQPDQLVLSIQKRLTELGYKPGPVDGLMGRKTADAIGVFQSDIKIYADGQATQGLLEILNQWKSTNASRTKSKATNSCLTHSDCSDGYLCDMDINQCISSVKWNQKYKNDKHRAITTNSSSDSFLSDAERNSIESACSYMASSGPGAFNKCMQKKIKELQQYSNVNFSRVSNSERNSIESACSYMASSGPGAFNKCMQKKIKELQQYSNVNFSGVSNSERNSIASACSYMASSGPGAFNKCMQKKVKKLKGY